MLSSHSVWLATNADQFVTHAKAKSIALLRNLRPDHHFCGANTQIKHRQCEIVEVANLFLNASVNVYLPFQWHNYM